MLLRESANKRRRSFYFEDEIDTDDISLPEEEIDGADTDVDAPSEDENSGVDEVTEAGIKFWYTPITEADEEQIESLEDEDPTVADDDDTETPADDVVGESYLFSQLF